MDCAGQLPVSPQQGGDMYNKPKLERFGSFRELTQLGFDADGDGGFHGIGNGCNILPSGDCRS